MDQQRKLTNNCYLQKLSVASENFSQGQYSLTLYYQFANTIGDPLTSLPEGCQYPLKNLLEGWPINKKERLSEITRVIWAE